MNYSRSHEQINNGPKLQQWAVITKHHALEQQKMKQFQKMEQYNKKMKFRSDLDQQLSQKNNVHLQDKQADRQYFEHIVKKGKQLQEREQRQRFERLLKRRKIQNQNHHLVEELKNSRGTTSPIEYELQIGLKSQMEQKLKEEKGKKQMMDTLDLQLKQKNQQSRIKKMQDYIKDLEHFQKEANIFATKKPIKQYKQDDRVYKHYEHLVQDRHKQQLQLDRRFVNEAAKQKSEQQQKRQKYEQQRRQLMTNSMKQTLDQQVKIHNYRKQQQKHVNPEDVSFGFISNVFKEKPPAYDKNKYYEDLRKQAQEQRLRKKQSKFMSEEEYKYNSNQLNKIVNGSYSYDKYVDRSLGAIGEKNIPKTVLQDQNSSFIRDRLQGIQQRRRGNVYSQLDYSYH